MANKEFTSTPQFYVSGPAFIFVGFGETRYTSEANLLGYCRDGVRFYDQPIYEPIYTDTYGPRVPDDYVLMGINSTISGVLAKYDDLVLNRIRRYGTHPLSQIGSVTGKVSQTTGDMFFGKMMRRGPGQIRLTVIAPNWASQSFFYEAATPDSVESVPYSWVRDYPTVMVSELEETWNTQPRLIPFAFTGLMNLTSSNYPINYTYSPVRITLPDGESLISP